MEPLDHIPYLLPGLLLLLRRLKLVEREWCDVDVVFCAAGRAFDK